MLMILFILSGCDVISPFVGEELKTSVCDRDHDGLGRSSDFCGGEDCDDADDTIGAPTGWYRDVDLDTYGAGEEEFSCSQPEGFVSVTGDCDDTDELVSPGGIESCNDIDDDCDGEIDEENITVWYLDADQDSYGNVDIYLVQCDEPVGYVDNAEDCDDLDPTINPDGVEICDDGIDQDCNGLTDDAEGSQIWYADVDLDGYGDPAVSLYSCTESVEGFVLDSGDCDDTNLDVNPSANEACEDGIDNDCDGEVDTDSVDVAWYADVDEDGYGDVSVTTTDCAPPEGYVGNSEDCDDESTAVNPGVEETCNNGVDDNCDADPGECILPTGTQAVTTADIIATYNGTSTGWNTSTGDLDGDGRQDFVLGVSYANTAAYRGGAVYVFFGSIPTGEVEMGDADLVIAGGQNENDNVGYRVAGADLTGDGVDDLIVTAPHLETSGGASGTIYIFFGPLSGGEMDINAADLQITGGSAYSYAGYSLTTTDLSGDSIADLAISAPSDDSNETDAGAVYVFFGPLSSGEFSISDADVTFTGEASGDQAGISLAVADDVNGDEIEDLIVGAPYNDTGETDAGAVYVLYGPLSTGTSSLSSASLKLTGETSGDQAGASVDAGDVNGDWVDDLAVGATGDDEGGSGAGAVYVLYGSLATGTISLSSASLKLTGETSGDQAGASVSCAGDVNNDDLDDLAIGAIFEATSAYQAGAAYLIYGDPSLTSGTLVGAEHKWTGEQAGSYLGRHVNLLDINGDDVEDLILATPNEDLFIILGTGY